MNQEEADTGHYLKCANPRISRIARGRYAPDMRVWAIFGHIYSKRDEAHGILLGEPMGLLSVLRGNGICIQHGEHGD